MRRKRRRVLRIRQCSSVVTNPISRINIYHRTLLLFNDTLIKFDQRFNYPKTFSRNEKRNLLKRLKEESKEVKIIWIANRYRGLGSSNLGIVMRDDGCSITRWILSKNARFPRRMNVAGVRGNSRNKPAWRTRRAMCRTWGSQWRSMARASSIRSTRSNISPAGIAGGTWTGLNPTRRMLGTVNQASHRKPSTDVHR